MEIKKIKELVKILENSELNDLHVKTESLDVMLSKGEKVVTAATVVNNSPMPVNNTVVSNEIAVEEAEVLGTEIKSPLVGTFYSSSSPTTAPFINVGDSVQKGQTICIVEAMKVMNEIKSPVSGIIRAINLSDHDFVEFDHVIAIVE